MSLMPEVLVRRELPVHTLRLKCHADMPPELGRLANHIQADNLGGAGTGHHERREDPKQSGLAATVWAEQPKQFSRMNFERNSVDGSSILVTMYQIAHRNDRTNWN